MTTNTEEKPVESLSPEALRVRVAKLCGWHAVNAAYFVGLPPDVPLPSTKPFLVGNECTWTLPAYATSLDAMATAEATLTDAERERYVYFLSQLVPHEQNCGPAEFEGFDLMFYSEWDLATATAEQRARAFVKAKEAK